MAIFHFSAKPISRAQGRSATGAAAYRAGVVIADERTGLVHDYSRKRGILHSELILPGGGATDRSEFWNRVETHHKRGDAVLVREIEISLPVELNESQRQILAVGYGRELADRYGVAADVALHAPRVLTNRDFERDPDQHWEIDPKTGQRNNGNWHAHIMLSACLVSSDGVLGKKAVELDPIHCKKNQVANLVDRERARWKDILNTALEGYGHAIRVDHRSLKDQGIDREPTSHLGPNATGYELRKHRPSRLGIEALKEIDERLARAHELGEINRQLDEIQQTIISLDTDISSALAERDAERKRMQVEEPDINNPSVGEKPPDTQRLPTNFSSFLLDNLLPNTLDEAGPPDEDENDYDRPSL